MGSRAVRERQLLAKKKKRGASEAPDDLPLSEAISAVSEASTAPVSKAPEAKKPARATKKVDAPLTRQTRTRALPLILEDVAQPVPAVYEAPEVIPASGESIRHNWTQFSLTFIATDASRPIRQNTEQVRDYVRQMALSEASEESEVEDAHPNEFEDEDEDTDNSLPENIIPKKQPVPKQARVAKRKEVAPIELLSDSDSSVDEGEGTPTIIRFLTYHSIIPL
jgi:hypothetical protein